MFGIRFLNIMRKSRNFRAFTQAYLAHAQTNSPAANKRTFQNPCSGSTDGLIEITNGVKNVRESCVRNE